MSQVKKNDSNPLGNLFKSIGDEAKRIGTETAKHVTESIDEVSKSVKDGGFIGGAMAVLDKTSLGTLTVGLVDVILPGEDLPKPLAEGLASFVNIATLNPIGLYDAAQGFAALAGPSAAKAPAAAPLPGAPPAGQRMQSPDSPTESYGRARPRPEPTPASPERIKLKLQEAEEVGGGSIRKDFSMRGGMPGMGMGVGMKTVVRGTNGADTIDISKMPSGDVKVTINGESVVMSAADARNLVVMGLDGNDKITVGPGLEGITVHGGGGDDIVKVGSNGAKITGGTGNDRLIVNGDGARVDGGHGNDRLDVRGDDANVTGGRGRDNIGVRGDGANVSGDRGRDHIDVRSDGRNTNVPRLPVTVDGGDETAYIGVPRGLDPEKMTPAEKKEAIAAAKEKAKAEAEAKAAAHNELIARANDVAQRGGGYAAVSDILDGLGDASMFYGSAIEDITKQGKANDSAKKKLAKMEAEAAKAISQLDKILNNPSLSFEDMIFMLMGELMEQSQKEVKGMTKEIRDQKAEFEKAKAEINTDFDASEAKVLDLEAKVRKDPKDEGAAKELGEAKSSLRKLGEQRNDKFSEFNDSRQEQIEALKNAMNKITEMQQALSNVLNSMHQTAMNTIGNIR